MGVLLALFEAGVEAPASLIGSSVGALNAASIAAYPSAAGAQMLRQIWLSDLARSVFQAHPVGILWSRLRGQPVSALPGTNLVRLVERQQELLGMTAFEQLAVPLTVVATDINAGRPHVFRSGPLTPALLASAAIPGVFPPLVQDGRAYYDGGIVENTPLALAVEQGAREVVGISLMAGGELEGALSWGELMARTLQLALHHQMLSEYERLSGRVRMVVLCPVTAPTEGWRMEKGHTEAVIDRTRVAMARLLATKGSRLFKHSGVHYLDLDGQ